MAQFINSKVQIFQTSEYNVRAIKCDISGSYNFSYPIMNTAEISNLFIYGGSVSVAMHGKSISIFEFDLNTNKLKVTNNGNSIEYPIIDKDELRIAMLTYYQDHLSEIMAKTNNTSRKKGKAKIGNTNAKKKSTIKNTIGETEYIEDLEEEPRESFYGSQLPKDFCTLNNFDGSPEEYFAWIDEKGYNSYVTAEDNEYRYECKIW